MTKRIDTHFFSLPDVESQIVEELNERERAEDMSSGLEQHLWGELEKARDERDEALARMIAAEEKLKTMEQLDILTTQRTRLTEQGHHRHERKLRAQRDEAIEQLQQVKAQKLQAVRVLVGADECCEACRVTSENESQRRAGGDDE